MSVTAVIPVKGLSGAKQRLSARLNPAERKRLVLRLLARELEVLGTICHVERIIVVTSDERVRAVAEMQGAVVALEPDDGVNAAITAGVEAAARFGAENVVALHGDLAFVTASDLEALIEASVDGVFAIAPDRRGEGTNAIVLRRTAPIELRFGAGSYARHIISAQRAGQEVREITRAGLSFDLDTPSDLIEFRRRLRSASRQALERRTR